MSGSTAIENLRIVEKETLGDVIVPSGGGLQLSVQTVPNFIELAPDKFEAYLKEEGLPEVIEWRASHQEASKPGRERYTKFAKSLLQTEKRDSFYKKPLGLLIEIIPLRDPSNLRPGDTLPVQVLFHGKPAADVQVEAARAASHKAVVSLVGRTDLQGKINVRIDQAGQWRLHSLKMQRCEDAHVADWESSWASLTFEISQ